MGWSIRKSKKVGPFRVSVGKTGFSTSVGVKGARARLNSKGRVYGSVGAMGLRAEQRLDGGGVRRATSRAANARGMGAAVTGCFSLVALLGTAFVLLVCSGMLFFPSTETTPAKPTHVAASSPDAPAPHQTAETTADPLPTIATRPAPGAAASTLVAEEPPGTREASADDGRKASPADVAEESAKHPLGSIVPALVPELNEEPRPWVDSTGRHSVVAMLVGLDDEFVKLRGVNGRVKSVPLAKLSAADAVYARVRTAPRVDPTAEVLLGTIVSISDGDTVQIRTIDEETKKVRLHGIDAPESGQPFGTRSQEQLGEFVFQKDVRVEVSELDRYGRYLGHIYVDDRWVNRAMIRSGMAWHYREFSKDPKLAQAESLARDESLGVWSVSDGVAPWDWRRGMRANEAVASPVAASAAPLSSPASERAEEERTVYVTASGSKYHRAGCQHLAKSSRAIPYSQAKERYSPCSRCRP